jgi:hypothetical protein
MYDSAEVLHANRMCTKEVLANCRNNIESLQNLSYLTSLDAESPSKVRLNIRMMEWHIRNLKELMLSA